MVDSCYVVSFLLVSRDERCLSISCCFLPVKDQEGHERCLFEGMVMGVDHCIEFCTVSAKNGDPHKLRDLRVAGLPCVPGLLL